ncbi:MAG: hypothetical protein DRJ32_03885 [Thermoprotei archaeon]|nr:MAG: hypothetical protein DRJ32_03885 [Thermoprotei archaeon]
MLSRDSSEKIRILLDDFVDGDIIYGAVVFNSLGVPIIWKLKPTIALTTVQNLMPLLEAAMKANKLSDPSLGPFFYSVYRFRNVKVSFANIDGSGYLIIIVNPEWHVELLLPKIRKLLMNLRRLL